MKTKPALEWADCVVELNPESTVDPYISLVIYPGNPEHNHTLRLYNTLVDVGFDKLRMPFCCGLQSLHDLFYSLMKLRLIRIGLLDLGYHIFDH